MALPVSAADRLVLVLLGTATLHVALGVGLSAVEPGARRPQRAPQLELVDLEPPPPPPPPEAKAPEPPPPLPTPATPPPPQAPRAPARVTRPAPAQPPPSEPPPADAPVDPAAGGAPVVKLDSVGPPGRGVPVATGKRTVGRVGKGGSGGGAGTGAGTGTAAGAPPPAPVSIAVLKTRARPKAGQDYDQAKDYPEEAKALGIEGQIKVRLTIGPDGKVQKTKILTRLGHGLDELALRYAERLVFEPARDTDDRAVASTEVWTFTFTLPR